MSCMYDCMKENYSIPYTNPHAHGDGISDMASTSSAVPRYKLLLIDHRKLLDFAGASHLHDYVWDLTPPLIKSIHTITLTRVVYCNDNRSCNPKM